MNNIFELNKKSFSKVCPYCNEALSTLDYFFYGWRNLYDCQCLKCKANFFIDMPIFSGVPYPAIYDKDKKKIVNNVAKWWGKPLKKISSRIFDENIISDVRIKKNKDKVIIFCLLDFVFGHSFMRLERLSYYIDNKEFKEYDFLVLVPSQLRYLLAKFEDVLSIIETKLSFPKYKYFYNCIDREIKGIVKNYSNVYCEMLKYPQQEFLNLQQLNLPIQKWVNKIEKIVIVYRKDRTVGINARSQYSFYKKLINLLKLLKIKIIIVGDKDIYNFKNIVDLRVIKFGKDTDIKWNMACSGAITIGIHGSNLLLPSLCSSYNIEFVNTEKLYNFGQATAFLETLNQQETIQKYRYIYGNEYLTDIKPKLVYEVVKSIVVKMNFTFNAVHEEKYANIEKVQEKYLLSNSCTYKINILKKVYKKIIQIRKKINL